jgi:predicted RNase H-like nuclease (RuvC/YqgF family)
VEQVAAAAAAAPPPAHGLEQARQEIEALQRELHTHKQACTSMNMRLNEVKVSLEVERHQRKALEAWQRDVLRLHRALLETRNSLWHTAKTFNGEEFTRMFQALSAALEPLMLLLAPDLPAPAP